MQQTLYTCGDWSVTSAGIENRRTGYFLRKGQIWEIYAPPKNDADFLQCLRRAREHFTPTVCPRSNKQRPE